MWELMSTNWIGFSECALIICKTLCYSQPLQQQGQTTFTIRQNGLQSR
jgi:hypothetical protein